MKRYVWAFSTVLVASLAFADEPDESKARFEEARKRMSYYYDKIKTVCDGKVEVGFDEASFKTKQAPMPFYDDLANACQGALEAVVSACESAKLGPKMKAQVAAVKCQRVIGKDATSKSSDDLGWDKLGFSYDKGTRTLFNRVWIKQRADEDVSSTKSIDRSTGIGWLEKKL